MEVLDYMLGKKAGGGSGGTTDYSQLTNKPSINEVTLAGNKSSSDLKLQSEINSTSKLDSDLVDDTNSTNKFVSASDITNWNGKQDTIQYSTMPTASDSTVGKIVQYIGTTDSNYTNGYFYKGISTTEGNETTYSWAKAEVQDLSGKQNVLTFDSTPTQNSTNPVTSNGIYEALQNAGGGNLPIYYRNVYSTTKIEDLDAGIHFIFISNTSAKIIYTSSSGGGTTQVFYASNPLKILFIAKKFSEAQINERWCYYFNPTGQFVNLTKASSTRSSTGLDSDTRWQAISPVNNSDVVNLNYTGNKNDLTTTTKTNLVNAINEINPTTYSGYDATKTQVLKNVNGTLTWIDE